MTEPNTDAQKLVRLDAETVAIEQAMREAVDEAVLLHKRLGLPMVEWIDGRIVWTPPDQLAVDVPAQLHN